MSYKATFNNISVILWQSVLLEEEATFNNISAILWQSVLLEEETGVPGEKTTTCRKSLTYFII